jgi:hypothetical protein
MSLLAIAALVGLQWTIPQPGADPREPRATRAGEPALPASAPPEMRALLPGVRVGEGRIEFEGEVCADASHPQTPVVYLELLVTGPDSREHESLVVTEVKPSVIHAGLLAAGLEPGRPVSWRGAKVDEHPEGPKVRVEAAVIGDDGSGPFVDLAAWAVHKKTGERLTDAEGWGLVFAGSRTDERGYAADETGTIVGLTGFGTEIVAAAWGLSPEAAVDEPVWIVDKERVPPVGSKVMVRVSRVDDADESDEEPEDPS